MTWIMVYEFQNVFHSEAEPRLKALPMTAIPFEDFPERGNSGEG